ncbi:hypothetical protein [Lactobacillus johnsonii]|uniref:hypothetical protein n=1 Tax=Lactobacillus johnsonii TaxID=33959 RepID=UPI001FD7B2EF|nr:hypothetical protein [Lactobacillus johnsonii]
MSLFGNREERIKRAREETAIKEQQKRNKYLEENKIKDIYTEENKVPMDVIIDMSQAKGLFRSFRIQALKLFMLNNWFLNDRIGCRFVKMIV